MAAGLAGLFVAGCSGDGHDPAGTGTAAPAVTDPPAVTASASASAATATGTATAKAAAPKPPAKPRVPKSYAALKSELDKKCPLETKQSNIEQKEAVMAVVQCLRKKMNADLDAVLVPLKTSDKAKLDALMKEQAEWNRNIETACRIEEERFWIDLTTGARDDGTLRGYTYMGCLEKAYAERTLYARALGAGNVAPLVKRIEEAQKEGAGVKQVLADVRTRADGFVREPPKLEAGQESADWKKIGDDIGKVQAAAKSMARSTCAAWPEVAKALGGKAECETKAELYYHWQGSEPSVGPE